MPNLVAQESENEAIRFENAHGKNMCNFTLCFTDVLFLWNEA